MLYNIISEIRTQRQVTEDIQPRRPHPFLRQHARINMFAPYVIGQGNRGVHHQVRFPHTYRRLDFGVNQNPQEL